MRKRVHVKARTTIHLIRRVWKSASCDRDRKCGRKIALTPVKATHDRSTFKDNVNQDQAAQNMQSDLVFKQAAKSSFKVKTFVFFPLSVSSFR